MEDTSFVSFVSSCLLEPEREALASKMNEDDDLSHLHDEAFLDFLAFPQDILIPLRDRAFSWDLSVENGLHADLSAAVINDAALLVRHNMNLAPPSSSSVMQKLDSIKVEPDSIFDTDVSELFDESLLHPNLIDPINNPLPEVRSESTSSGNKPKITIKFNDKLLKQETDAKALEQQQHQQPQYHHNSASLAVNQNLLEKINTNNTGENHEGKRVIQSPHMVPLASLNAASSSGNGGSSSSGPVSTYMNHSMNKVASTGALNDYNNSTYSSSGANNSNGIPSLKRSLSAPSGKDMLDGNGMRPIGSYHYNDMLSISTNHLPSANGPQSMPNLNGQGCSPNFDNASYLLMNTNGNNVGHERRVGAYTIEERRQKIEKFRERKRARIWRKQIKYDCRKRLADTRPRVKGRFVSRKNMTKEELESLLSPEKEGEEDDESVGSHSMEPESSNSVAMMEIASPEPVNKVLNVVDV